MGNGEYQSYFKKGNLGGGDGGKSWSDNTNFNNGPQKMVLAPLIWLVPAPLIQGVPVKRTQRLARRGCWHRCRWWWLWRSRWPERAKRWFRCRGSLPIAGQAYGNINVEALLAGSGGGGGKQVHGGTGAGAIKITAGGTLTIGADIYAEGGQGGYSPDPTDGFNGPVLWFDAADESSVIQDANGKVYRWIDKTAPDYSSSNTNNHMVQATAANQPTWGTRTYNGLPVMDFDGNDWLETLNNLNANDGPSTSHSSFHCRLYRQCR